MDFLFKLCFDDAGKEETWKGGVEDSVQVRTGFLAAIHKPPVGGQGSPTWLPALELKA